MGRRIFEDLDTVEADAEFVFHGVVVDVGEAQDPNAEDIIWKLIEWGGRGTVKRDGGFRYKVTGPSYELMNSFEYGRLYEERKKRWYFPKIFPVINLRSGPPWEGNFLWIMTRRFPWNRLGIFGTSSEHQRIRSRDFIFLQSTYSSSRISVENSHAPATESCDRHRPLIVCRLGFKLDLI